MFPLSETGRFSGVLPTQCPRAGLVATILKKFAWGSNLALVFEVGQPKPLTTFPESWHDYWKQYFSSFGQEICLPIIQIGDIDKITM